MIIAQLYRNGKPFVGVVCNRDAVAYRGGNIVITSIEDDIQDAHRSMFGPVPEHVKALCSEIEYELFFPEMDPDNGEPGASSKIFAKNELRFCGDEAVATEIHDPYSRSTISTLAVSMEPDYPTLNRHLETPSIFEMLYVKGETYNRHTHGPFEMVNNISGGFKAQRSYTLDKVPAESKPHVASLLARKSALVVLPRVALGGFKNATMIATMLSDQHPVWLP